MNIYVVCLYLSYFLPCFSNIEWDIPQQYKHLGFSGVISEDDYIVHVTPDIKIISRPNIKICSYSISHTPNYSIPFQIHVKNKALGLAHIIAVSKLNCQTHKYYNFNISAIDCLSNESSISIPVHINVLDVNEYDPYFEKNIYSVDIISGKLYDKLLVLSAKDKDCSSDFSSICSYSVISGNPLANGHPTFIINNEGVVQNLQTLENIEKTYNLEIIAEDCGGRKSKPILLYIRVLPKLMCINTWKNIASRKYIANKFNPILLAPKATLQICPICQTGQFKTTVIFESFLDLDRAKGCDRGENVFSQMTATATANQDNEDYYTEELDGEEGVGTRTLNVDDPKLTRDINYYFNGDKRKDEGFNYLRSKQSSHHKVLGSHNVSPKRLLKRKIRKCYTHHEIQSYHENPIHSSITTNTTASPHSSDVIDLLDIGFGVREFRGDGDNIDVTDKFKTKSKQSSPTLDPLSERITEPIHGLGRNFSLALWMRHAMNLESVKEHLFCRSDTRELNRHHLALFVKNCKLVLLIREELYETLPTTRTNKTPIKCQGLEKDRKRLFTPSEIRWKLPEVCDSRWHHYAVNVMFPHNFQLIVDGKLFKSTATHLNNKNNRLAVTSDLGAIETNAIDHVPSYEKQLTHANKARNNNFKLSYANPQILEDWPLHAIPFKLKKHGHDLASAVDGTADETRDIVGACWEGKLGRMDKFFRGYLSEFVLVKRHALAREIVSDCLLNCAEGLASIPATGSPKEIIELSAGTPSEMESLVRSVVYGYHLGDVSPYEHERFTTLSSTLKKESIKQQANIHNALSIPSSYFNPIPGIRRITFKTSVICNNANPAPNLSLSTTSKTLNFPDTFIELKLTTDSTLPPLLTSPDLRNSRLHAPSIVTTKTSQSMSNRITKEFMSSPRSQNTELSRDLGSDDFKDTRLMLGFDDHHDPQIMKDKLVLALNLTQIAVAGVNPFATIRLEPKATVFFENNSTNDNLLTIHECHIIASTNTNLASFKDLGFFMIPASVLSQNQLQFNRAPKSSAITSALLSDSSFDHDQDGAYEVALINPGNTSQYETVLRQIRFFTTFELPLSRVRSNNDNYTVLLSFHFDLVCRYQSVTGLNLSTNALHATLNCLNGLNGTAAASNSSNLLLPNISSIIMHTKSHSKHSMMSNEVLSKRKRNNEHWDSKKMILSAGPPEYLRSPNLPSANQGNHRQRLSRIMVFTLLATSLVLFALGLFAYSQCRALRNRKRRRSFKSLKSPSFNKSEYSQIDSDIPETVITAKTAGAALETGPNPEALGNMASTANGCLRSIFYGRSGAGKSARLKLKVGRTYDYESLQEPVPSCQGEQNRDLKSPGPNEINYAKLIASTGNGVSKDVVIHNPSSAFPSTTFVHYLAKDIIQHRPNHGSVRPYFGSSKWNVAKFVDLIGLATRRLPFDLDLTSWVRKGRVPFDKNFDVTSNINNNNSNALDWDDSAFGSLDLNITVNPLQDLKLTGSGNQNSSVLLHQSQGYTTFENIHLTPNTPLNSGVNVPGNVFTNKLTRSTHDQHGAKIIPRTDLDALSINTEMGSCNVNKPPYSSFPSSSSENEAIYENDCKQSTFDSDTESHCSHDSCDDCGCASTKLKNKITFDDDLLNVNEVGHETAYSKAALQQIPLFVHEKLHKLDGIGCPAAVEDIVSPCVSFRSDQVRCQQHPKSFKHFLTRSVKRILDGRTMAVRDAREDLKSPKEEKPIEISSMYSFLGRSEPDVRSNTGLNENHNATGKRFNLKNNNYIRQSKTTNPGIALTNKPPVTTKSSLLDQDLEWDNSM